VGVLGSYAYAYISRSLLPWRGVTQIQTTAKQIERAPAGPSNHACMHGSRSNRGTYAAQLVPRMVLCDRVHAHLIHIYTIV